MLCGQRQVIERASWLMPPVAEIATGRPALQHRKGLFRRGYRVRSFRVCREQGFIDCRDHSRNKLAEIGGQKIHQWRKNSVKIHAPDSTSAPPPRQ